jgi:hypothetical protein
MERLIKVVVTNTAQLPERVIDFFKQFNFKLTDRKEGYLKFRQNSSLLEAWKTNPLNRDSEIIVTIVERNVIANFRVDTDAQMKTNEEENVWLTFIESFQVYLTKGITYNPKLTTTITTYKKSRLSYFSWAILGAIIGGMLSLLYSKLTGNISILSVFLIPVAATFFLGWRINYVKAKNA